MWICDTCGEDIVEAEDGWVEWISFPKSGPQQKKGGRDLRLVHRLRASPLRDTPMRRCQFDGQALGSGIIGDVQLPRFLGPDGLMTLLSFIAEERLPRDEVLEMIKRLHIPGYERARLLFDAAIRDSVFEPNTAPGYYRQSDINEVLRWSKEYTTESKPPAVPPACG